MNNTVDQDQRQPLSVVSSLFSGSRDTCCLFKNESEKIDLAMTDLPKGIFKKRQSAFFPLNFECIDNFHPNMML
jgi:hypothetical protein